MQAFDDCARRIATSSIVPWEEYEGKTVVVTGATGLIGRTLVASLLARNTMGGGLPIEVVALARDFGRAESLLGSDPHLSVLFWNAGAGEAPNIPDAGFVLHCAAPTGSRFFVERPVETIETVVGGTAEMLRLALQTGAALVFLSSMEVYGEASADPLGEVDGGAMDSMCVRNSYPEAKRLAEALCAGYASEHGVRACSARLAQCFGPGVDPADGRVFAEFARCASRGEDIVLLTKGEKRNMYVSTHDAATAVLLLGAKGAAGEAYNVANPGTLTSVREMADMVAREFGGGRMGVVVREDPEAAARYRKGLLLLLLLDKVSALGWSAEDNLPAMYGQMISDWGDSV